MYCADCEKQNALHNEKAFQKRLDKFNDVVYNEYRKSTPVDGLLPLVG